MRTDLLCVVVFVSAGGVAAAQSPPVLVAPRAGAAQVEGACTTGATVSLTVTTNSTKVALSPVVCANGVFTVNTSTVVMEVGSQLEGTQSMSGTTSPPAVVKVVLDGPFGDERDTLETSFYVGLAVDRFASEEIQKYLNPEDNGKEYVRGIGGVDFEYRLFALGGTQRPQLWVYGETIHGVRSEDVDCTEAEYLPTCQQELSGFGTNPPGAFLYMLRKASTLEAFTGLRFELFGLNLPGTNPARVYVKRQFGFVEVSRGDGDTMDMHHWGIGATVVGGSRAGSYLELGYGRTDGPVQEPSQ